MNVSSATINPIMGANGTVDIGQSGVTNPTVQHSVGAGSITRTPTTTVPVSVSWEGLIALSGGAYTLDLTALPGGNLPDLDLTGKKVQAIHVRGANDLTGPITLSVGASNGYDLHGSGVGEEIATVEADDEVLILKNDTAPDVGASACQIDLAGTSTEEVSIMILAG